MITVKKTELVFVSGFSAISGTDKDSRLGFILLTLKTRCSIIGETILPLKSLSCVSSRGSNDRSISNATFPITVPSHPKSNYYK